jgi:hypothetical protein
MCYECENSGSPICYDEFPSARDEEYIDFLPEMVVKHCSWCPVHNKPDRRFHPDGEAEHREAEHRLGKATNSVTTGDIIHVQLTQEKGKQVRTISDRKQALQRQAEELLLRLDRLSKVPDTNPFTDGEVFKVSKRFGEQSYTYGVVYVAGVFYTTGSKSNTQQFYSWEQFVDWLGEDVSTIECSIGWVALIG